MKYLFYAIFVLLVCGCNNYSNDKSEFTNKNKLFTNEDYFEYGTVKESDSIISHIFFINNGTQHTQFIDHIESSCGCTKVFADCDSIVPGGDCKIEAKIKTVGYMGNILREIDVYFVGIDTPLTFSVAAYIPMPIKAIKAKYSTKIYKDIYTCYNVINIGNVYKGSINYGYTELVNMSDNTIRVKTHSYNKHVNIDNPEELEPLVPARFYVYYDNSSVDYWGVDTTIIYIDIENASIPIKCIANILPFPKRKPVKISPRILNNSTEIRKSSTEPFCFKFHNIGAEPLKIIDYKTSNNINILKIDTIIEPSLDGIIKCKKTNNVNGHIDILTNDPLSPIVRYRIITPK